MLDITPSTHIIESYRNNIPNYRILCGEAVDNSFDAGATTISITIDKQKISFLDNGEGITNSRVVSLFKLGSHAPMNSTALGRYGIGIKEQAAAAGDAFDVTSRSSDGRMRLGINWAKLSASNDWRSIVDPMWDMNDNNGDTYTEIKISALRNIPKQSQINRITDELARIFQPALVSGRKITLNGAEIRPIADPAMKHIIRKTIAVDSDKFAEVTAGVLADPDNSSLNSVHISYKHRVIMPQSLFGCDDGIGAPHMFARVTLHGKWSLGKNKTELTDEDSVYLEDSLEEILAPILEKCRKQRLSAVVSAAEVAINDMLPSDLKPNRPEKKSKEPPRQGDKKGRKEPRLVKDGSDSSTGPTRGSSKSSRISFDLVPNLKDQHGADVIGQVKRNGKQVVVQVRSNQPEIKDLIERKNFGPLYLIGLQIYAEGIRRINCELDLSDYGAHVFQLINMQGEHKKLSAA